MQALTDFRRTGSADDPRDAEEAVRRRDNYDFAGARCGIFCTVWRGAQSKGFALLTTPPGRSSA